jgi:SAM-dependent methyltransferase
VPLDDASIDTVVMTWTLCTIPDAPRALAELRRVLRPGGALLFVEHGRAPEPGVARWQDRLDPLWRRVAGGCHLNRKIDNLVSGGGFRIDTLTNARLPGPRTPHLPLRRPRTPSMRMRKCYAIRRLCSAGPLLLG